MAGQAALLPALIAWLARNWEAAVPRCAVIDELTKARVAYQVAGLEINATVTQISNNIGA